MRIVLTEIPDYIGGYSIWHPDFQTKPLQEIEESHQEEFNTFWRIGYNSFTIHRATATIFINKIQVKTMSDILLTDPQGLLK